MTDRDAISDALRRLAGASSLFALHLYRRFDAVVAAFSEALKGFTAEDIDPAVTAYIDADPQEFRPGGLRQWCETMRTQRIYAERCRAESEHKAASADVAARNLAKLKEITGVDG